MRDKVIEIAKKAINKTISEEQAEQELIILFNKKHLHSSEKKMLPLDERRLFKLLYADGDKCFYCGVKTFHAISEQFDNSSTIDHVLPKKKGGTDHIDNCVISCRKCNNLKGGNKILPPPVQLNKIRQKEFLKTEAEYWKQKLDVAK